MKKSWALEMQKIILDTNVVVSSLISKNYPYFIVKRCIEKKLQICLSDSVFREYKEVLARPKFVKFPDFRDNANFLLLKLSAIAVFYNPTKKLRIIRDVPDNRILELAQASTADFLITGNTNDFTMPNFEETRITTPSEYWTKFRT